MTSFGKIVLGEHDFSKKERKGTMLPQANPACIWANVPLARRLRNLCKKHELHSHKPERKFRLRQGGMRHLFFTKMIKEYHAAAGESGRSSR
jgi:hypothetical protein